MAKHNSESMPAIEHCLLIEEFRLKSIMPVGQEYISPCIDGH